MRWCDWITDVGLAHLVGIHTLIMYNCNAAIIVAARARFPPRVIAPTSPDVAAGKT
jgi:hypothetical protein